MFRYQKPSSPDASVVRRGRVVLAVLAVCALAVCGRLVQLQIVQHASWRAAASSSQERTFELMPRRGSILDRNGTLLAFDVKATAIAADGFNMTKPLALADILVEELGMARAEVNDVLYRASYFTWIDRGVDLETAQRIQHRAAEAGAYGLIFIDTWKRRYPQGSLASNLIGFVGLDGAGLEGLELAYDESLRGTPTEVHVLQGADGRTYETEVVTEGEEGRDLVLSLDASLQFACEEEIAAGVDEYRASAGMAIVLDPLTGEVLAMAQDRTYDLNRFWSSVPADRRNLAVTYMFEPGSVFKVFAGVSALQAGVVDVADEFDGDDGYVVSGHTIHNADNWDFGRVTFADVIKDSINTGMVQVALGLGEDRLHETLLACGFGQLTGIELPGEVDGILRSPDRWTPLDLASSSIGQSIAVTGIQLACGVAAVANGGDRINPRIVLETASTRAAEALSAADTATMRRLMVSVVESGTGVLAAVDGFAVAGKTGTAQKAEPGRGYVDGKYTTLFAGFFPAEAPEVVILVMLDEPRVAHAGGGSTAAPIFARIAERLVLYAQMVPTAN